LPAKKSGMNAFEAGCLRSINYSKTIHDDTDL
jgi:hypothetical protein